MEVNVRPMTEQERRYTYRQSSTLDRLTGCIGRMRADFGSSGKAFYHSWEDRCPDLKTDEFQEEINQVIDALRLDDRYGGMLRDRDSMSKYGYTHPESNAPGNYCTEFFFRAETKKYAYMLRMNPTKGDYNLYCFAYVKEHLDRHLTNAARGIRIVNSDYDELFRIQDDDQIRITFPDGRQEDKTVRYIDPTHFEVGAFSPSLFHHLEYGEMLDRTDATVIPMRRNLPDQCYDTLKTTGEIIIVKKGETGYYRTDIDAGSREANRALVDEYNQNAGVTKAQAAAMSLGSMCGWGAPGADPKIYDENGLPLKKRLRGGDAR